MSGLVIGGGFLASLTRFSGSEKGRALDFLAEFQKNPANPGASLERIQNARSPNVWSARITQGLRAILYKDGETWVVLHGDRHDEAYRWAERHEVGRHPVTGALQLVEVAQGHRSERPPAPPHAVDALPSALFAKHADAYLLSLGVPVSWMPVVREIRTDDELLEVCDRLPQDVAERLLGLADGKLVTPPPPIAADAPIAATAEARQQFYVVDDRSDLQKVLEAPMERWIAFLHPSQRKLVEGTHAGPVKVAGSAGTGKTTVALHRARVLARRCKRVLLCTYVSTLAHNLLRQLRLICNEDELARITVSTVHARALAIARVVDGRADIAEPKAVHSWLDTMRLRHAPGLDAAFVRAEWEAVVEVQGLETWAEYRSARRVGRGKPLSVAERKTLWAVFEPVIDHFRSQRQFHWSGVCRYAESLIAAATVPRPYDAVLVDEVQDLRPPELRFLGTLAAAAPGDLMLFGDAGQRIYSGGFSLSSLGIDVRGRSHVLRLNYRTTEQIRRAADAIVGSPLDDLDGGSEDRRGTRSLLRGPVPVLQGYELREAETDALVRRVREYLSKGVPANSVAVFARTNARVSQVCRALGDAGIETRELASDDGDHPGGVNVGTMHRAKGLEFRVVLVVDASDGTLPSRAALEAQGDPLDREETEQRERQLLYVAMTRARDELVISWTGKPSVFLAPLLAPPAGGSK